MPGIGINHHQFAGFIKNEARRWPSPIFPVDQRPCLARADQFLFFLKKTALQIQITFSDSPSIPVSSFYVVQALLFMASVSQHLSA